VNSPYVAAMTVTSAMGTGLAATRAAIVARRSGLAPDAWPEAGLPAWLGAVTAVATAPWPDDWAAWDSRNNRLAWLGLQQDGLLDRVRAVRAAVGPGRIGLALGTSTASIGRTEAAFAQLQPDGDLAPAYRQPTIHAPHSTAAFLAAVLGIDGPCVTVSTACSSSAKAVGTAARWLEADLVDAVLVAGVDSLCRSTLHGFHALQLLDPERCRPFDARRAGLNIGEAAAFALLVRARPDAPVARVLGCGESGDAHHMSSPHPEGLGARLALERALAQAGLAASAIDYVNLHGTATRTNDSVDAAVLAATLPAGVLASSTKGWTGHTLGAAGLVEAVLAIDTLATGLVPGTLNLTEPDPALPAAILRENRPHPVAVAASNSFGFGGSNCVLLFGRA
jgi:3-oxoacyl-[acyl-carrier-protein] synthase-1